MMLNQNQINTAIELYSKLPSKTETNNVHIASVYGLRGVKYAKAIKGVFTLRIDSPTHFGNPYSSRQDLVEKHNLLYVASTKDAVVMYMAWVLYGKDSRATWIRNTIRSGVLKDKPLIYYKELNEPSHANGLDYLINSYSWE